MTLARVLLAALLFAFAETAAAQDAFSPKVQIRLVAERDEVAPGGTVVVALEQKIRAGWHSYWRNSGEAGAPTEITWTLPPGWQAGPIQWPMPRRLPVGPLMQYGYAGTPWLLVTLRAAADAAPGSQVVLRAAVDWLVCSETLCVPEQGIVSVPLAIANAPRPPQPAIEAQFDGARAQLPVASPWPARFSATPSLDLFLAAPSLAALPPREAVFFPYAEGLVRGSAPQTLAAVKGGIVLHLAAGGKVRQAAALDGVLELTSQDGSVQALEIAAAPGAVPAADDVRAGLSGIAIAVLFAVLGGLILNLMPCVLPVLAMKAFSVASKAGAHPAEAAREGLAYGTGAVGSFLVLGGAVIALRAGGEAVGWGFQLQDPRVVAGFALLMFAVGLNLSGVFEWTGAITAGDALARKGGATGAFFTGVLAVAVAAPCTAPFMAGAIGFALTQGPATALGIFAALGIGFAAPFVAIGLSPALLRLLPRPGVWMLYFKQLLAFPMYGAAAWLVWVTAQEAGPTGLAGALAALVAFAFAAWVWTASRGGRWRLAGAVIAALGAVAALVAISQVEPNAVTAPVASNSATAALHPEPYSAARLVALRARHRPVFVDATAAWCITCLVNERVALSSPEIAAAFARTQTVYMVADWTRRDGEITALLAAHDRSGVPLYLYYGPGAATAEVLPQVLTSSDVLAAIDRRN